MIKLSLPKAVQINAFIFVSFILISPLSISAAVSNWQQGASINPTYSGDFSSSSFQQSVRDLAETGANYVNLTIPYYQSNIYSTDIQRGNSTPSDQSLRDAVNYAHSRGMKVMFKFHIDSYDGNWRAYINPGDRATWFNNYENALMQYARLAQSLGVEDLCIGAETISMTSEGMNSSNTYYWNRIIANVRSVYSGKLTYSSQRTEGNAWDAFNEQYGIKFWDKLDYLGISGYFPLASYTNNPSKQQIMDDWNNIEREKILPFQQMYNKPLLFTEIGYRSLLGANRDPWDYNRQDQVSQELQANLYDALMQFWNNKEYFKGVHLWEWESNPNAGGWNTSFTAQNKTAEEIMKKWFSGDPTTPTEPTPPTQPSAVTIAGTVTPSPIIVNQSGALKVNVKSNSAISNAIVDIEVYNSSDQKVFQQYLSNQTINANIDNNFQVNWTPNTTGNYTLKAGVFNSSWSQLYKWEGNAATFSVNNQQTPPTPPVNAAYTFTATNNPTSPKVNEGNNINVSVTSNTNVNDSIIDVEVYNSSDQRVFQQFFTGQNLTANQAKSFSVNFTANTPGKYTIKAGVFNNGWGNLVWNGNIKQFDVQNASTPVPPTPVPSTEITMINPTNGANLNGLVTFKGSMQNRALNTYKMYWRVDDGQLNEMSDSNGNKESLIDLSGWNWKGNGPYKITFVAKELNGNVISEKSANINISR